MAQESIFLNAEVSGKRMYQIIKKDGNAKRAVMQTNTFYHFIPDDNTKWLDWNSF